MVSEILKPQKSGWIFLFTLIFSLLADIALLVYSIILTDDGYMGAVWGIFASIFLLIIIIILLCGFFIVEPNEAVVLLLFGKYKGTEKNSGFKWANPFYTKKKISLRSRNFNSDKLKVNDKVYDLKPEWIKIEPDNDDPSVEHNIFVELNDLRNTEIQGIKPGQKVTLEYPMAAVNLTKDDSLVTNCEWTANTYPRGQPIIITQMGKEEKGIVPVTHQRIKVVRGKALLATEDEKIHDVVLSLQNNSGFDVSNFVVKDAAPAGYDAYEFSMKPDENTEKVGDREAMVWKLEKIEKDATVEIKYKIKAVKEDAYASDAQFSL